ncbi:hypothetical protein ACFZDI_35865, partial [Streptomyces sp. NPDC007907]|uniref:hypothetical protein n=1 Tax=Streptomyces sp. NPDC007907 TaxID=3364789 RepID=UPI0036E7E5FA
DTLGFVHLTAPTGTIHTMPTLEEIRSQPGVIQASLKVGPGDVVGETAVTFDRAGDVVVAGPDTAAVQDALTRCATWFTAHTEVA